MELYSATKESKFAFGKMDESKKYSIKRGDSKSEGGKKACSPSYKYADLTFNVHTNKHTCTERERARERFKKSVLGGRDCPTAEAAVAGVEDTWGASETLASKPN